MINKHGRIILVNGTSSSGKTSILKNLQAIAPSAQFLSVDDYYDNQVIQTAQKFGWDPSAKIDPWLFLNQYLTHKTGNYYFDTEVRQQLFTASDFFYSKAKSAAIHGKTVFVDTVLEYESAYQEAFNYFKNEHFSMILIYCPMSIILQRVQERNSSGISSEHRSVFLPFEHFTTMYKVRENAQDPLVDTINTSTLKHALIIAIEELINQGIAKEYLPRLEQFKENFIAQFKLDQIAHIEITPQHHYVAIFKNDSPESPEIIAQQIKESIIKNN
jgi:chloramphenicol 3-O-phosphotransferase